MKRPVLVDTDVMIDFLRGHPHAVALLQSHGDRIILSAMVAAELHAGVRDEDEQGTLDRLLAVLPVVPVTPALARAGGRFRRAYGKSHGVGLADAIIAATAEAEAAELKTLNTKHYPMFIGLKPAYGK